jgi:predicted TPR repeat methyltransferase
MTQPTSVDMTFDTSLVDLKPNLSFSTTESDPTSEFDNSRLTTSRTPTIQPSSLFEDNSQETPQPSQTPSKSTLSSSLSASVQHLPTQDAYDQWASVYDTDGNMLQAIDDMELATVLPHFLQQVVASVTTSTISLLDLGCGTGRNTAKLLSYALPPGRSSTVTGLDFSSQMLNLAHQKLAVSNDRLQLAQCDCFPTATSPSASPFPSVPGLTPVDALISTLVLEHVPLPSFFATLHSLLRPNGLALVTNMHDQMGASSQAGFVNAQGVKVRGTSHVHTVADTLDEARKAGLDVLSVREREVRTEDLESTGGRGRKWVGVRVWFGVVLRRVERD